VARSREQGTKVFNTSGIVGTRNHSKVQSLLLPEAKKWWDDEGEWRIGVQSLRSATDRKEWPVLLPGT